MALICPILLAQNARGQSKEQLRRFDQLMGEGKNAEARILLTEISKGSPSSPELMFLSARFYASQKNYRLALLFLNQAMEKLTSPGYEHWFLLGDVQQKSNLFGEAAESFTQALGFKRNRAEVSARIRQCRLGEELKARPLEVRISNPGEPVNTAADEFRPMVSPDFLQLYFIRLENEGASAYQSTASHNQWEKVSAFLLPGGSPALKFQFSGISGDGKTMILESGKGKGDLYFADWENGKWSEPEPFSGNSPKSKESSASLSADGKLLFFVSDRSGNPDIWYCQKNGKGWGKPQRAGAEINSAQAEESPWLDADGQYLYFSSKGHEGLGGFDVFKVPFTKKGLKPENIGYPINSASDDLHFVLLPDEKTAFYSSYREGGQGGSDIFSVRMSMTGNAQLVLFKGSVSDAYGSPLDATVIITESGQSNPLAKLKANKETGTFVTLLPAGKTYSVLAEKEGYLFHSDFLNFQESNREKDSERKIKLQKLLAGTALVLQNIFFDAGKSSLRKESSPELQRLLLILRQNPGIRAEISGHIEAGGPEDLLVKLTENRAQAVVDYLVATGIKSSRLIAKGYGSSKTTASKAGSESSGARTEFKVLSIQ